MTKHLKKAIAYVRENVDREEVIHAIFRMDKWRCPLSMASDYLHMRISDLMDEYAQDNNLPDGWWHEEMDVDDIVFEI